MLKYILVILFLVIKFMQGFSQDQFTTVNGAVIDCEIISIDSSMITFITDYGNGPINSPGKIDL